jgi:small nuclear ribonucleoprotein (snRNP)-like protein
VLLQLWWIPFRTELNIFDSEHSPVYCRRSSNRCAQNEEPSNMTKIIQIACGVVALAALSGWAAEPLTARTTVLLRDGSRLIGRPLAATLHVRASFAAMDIPITSVREIQTGRRAEGVTVLLQNGDRLTGQLTATNMTMDGLLGKLVVPWVEIERLTVTLSGGPLLPAGDGPIAFGGVNWTAWRAQVEVQGEKVVTLPRARKGYNYGHGGNGRGATLVTNVGSEDWKDYRIECEVGMTGVNLAFNPHGLPRDFRSASIWFHVADMKENWNERGTSAYWFSVEGDGKWSLGCLYNSFCNALVGYVGTPPDETRRLASGDGIKVDQVKGNRVRIDVVGKRIQIWVDDRAIVDVVDEKMDRDFGGQRIDHGGVAIQWGFECMGWLGNFSATRL